MRLKQCTINHIVKKHGIGLHSGLNISVQLKPAPANTGVVFRRIDIANASPLATKPENVHSTQLATTLGNGENKVSTIEHLLAALSALGIYNIFIEVDGAELPIFDGSAAVWIDLIQKAGRKELKEDLLFYLVTKPFKVTCGDKYIEVYPASNFSVEANIDFPGAIGKQTLFYNGSENNFLQELAPCRTFCMLKDVEMMKKNGLALGGSLDNAVVVGDDGILNPEGLRFQDEFVRHKILDFIGDMYVAGAPIVGKFVTNKSGHELNRRFLMEIFAEPGLLLLTSTKLEEKKKQLAQQKNIQSTRGGFLLPLEANACMTVAS